MRTNPSSSSFSPAFRHLQQEHEQLQQQLLTSLQSAARIQTEDIACYKNVLTPIHEQMQVFLHVLTAHFHKEETILYPLLAKHLAPQAGPIAVMEFEHEQICFHLRTFLSHTEDLDERVPRAEAKSLLYHLAEAKEILTGHFEKEENLLYPLAEKLLSLQDKQQLSKDIAAS